MCDGHHVVSGFQRNIFNANRCLRPSLLNRTRYVALRSRTPVRRYASHGFFERIVLSVTRRVDKCSTRGTAHKDQLINELHR